MSAKKRMLSTLFLLATVLLVVAFFSSAAASPEGEDGPTPQFKKHESGAWAIVLGGRSRQEAWSPTVDDRGILRVTGTFRHAVDFNPSEKEDVKKSRWQKRFILKLSTKGEYLGIDFVAGPQGNASCKTDSHGNLYFASWGRGDIDFDPGEGEDIKKRDRGYFYISRINADGTYGWTWASNGELSTRGSKYDYAIDGKGNVYLTGCFWTKVVFDPENSGKEYSAQGTAGTNNFFLLKLNPDGSFAWVWIFTGEYYNEGFAVDIDGAGNVYATGKFWGEIDCNPLGESDKLTSRGSYDCFITRINADGSYGWSKSIGGTHQDWPQDIVVSPAGVIYIAGEFGNSVDFDPNAGEFAVESGKKGHGLDQFLLKLDTEGNFKHVYTFGGTAWDSLDMNHVAVDGKGNLYLAGSFKDEIDFDPSDGEDIHKSNDVKIRSDIRLVSDAFITKIKADGSYGWTKTFGGKQSDSIGGIAIDKDGNVYAVGSFEGKIDFQTGGEEDIRRSLGEEDFFILKIPARK